MQCWASGLLVSMEVCSHIAQHAQHNWQPQGLDAEELAVGQAPALARGTLHGGVGAWHKIGTVIINGKL